VTIDHSEKLDVTSKADENPLRVFFNEAYHAFLKAREVSSGSIDRFYTISGFTIRLRFAGSALMPLIMPALEHLNSEPPPKWELTVNLWDTFSTGTGIPRPPWSIDDYDARGEVCRYNKEGIYTAFHLAPGTFSMLNSNLNQAVYWVRDYRKLPYYESGSPLLRILHWWMQERGLRVIHAGSVGTHDGGVLLAGKGGSGKSTIALSCLDSGLLYAGDDYVLLSGGSIPFVHCIYNSGKLYADQMKYFDHLKPAVSNPEMLGEEKALIFLHGHYSNKLTRGFPIQAILSPRITELKETTLTPASPMIGLRDLAPSTMFQLPGTKPETLRVLARLVKQVPCFNIWLGKDLSQIPETILRLLSELKC